MGAQIFWGSKYFVTGPCQVWPRKWLDYLCHVAFSADRSQCTPGQGQEQEHDKIKDKNNTRYSASTRRKCKTRTRQDVRQEENKNTEHPWCRKQKLSRT